MFDTRHKSTARTMRYHEVFVRLLQIGRELERLERDERESSHAKRQWLRREREALRERLREEGVDPAALHWLEE